MSKKVFNLVSDLIEAAQSASIALMTYFSTERSIAINSDIVIISITIIKICSRFGKD